MIALDHYAEQLLIDQSRAQREALAQLERDLTMRQYFTKSMTYTKPEPRHRLCWQSDHGGLVTLQQRGKDNFAVRYGKQVDADLTYAEACGKLGQAIMHDLACSDGPDGRPLVDNRTRGER